LRRLWLTSWWRGAMTNGNTTTTRRHNKCSASLVGKHHNSNGFFFYHGDVSVRWWSLGRVDSYTTKIHS
jgi:hypothetical protein